MPFGNVTGVPNGMPEDLAVTEGNLVAEMTVLEGCGGGTADKLEVE